MPDFSIMKDQVEFACTLSLKGTKLSDLSDLDRETLLKLMLSFNVFEAMFGQKPEQICKDLLECRDWFNVKDYDTYGKFFVNRYFNEEGNYDNHKLFRDENSAVAIVVKDVIERLKEGEYDEKLFYAYLEIAYRFRNNLFHGGKDVLELGRYTDCFEMITWMMYKLLGDIVDNKFAGLPESYPRCSRWRQEPAD